VHGIALAQSPDLKSLNSTLAQLRDAGAAGGRSNLEKTNVSAITGGAQQLLLNDIVFRQYHLSNTETRILSAKESEDAERAAAAAPAAASVPAEAAGGASGDSAKAAEGAVAEPKAAEPVSTDALVAPPTAPVAAAIPEISVEQASGLPQTPRLVSAEGTGATASFRITARLVDVSLVALDKKGRPITNLNPDELEVYDNGVKVDVRSFSQAAPPVTADEPAKAENEPAFSNRGAAPGKAKAGEFQNTLIFLIDNTLSFADLGNVREQMGRFLAALHEDEPAAIYVMRTRGFSILQNTTTDHQLIAKTLAKWVPSASNISLGQEQEARNRQQEEYVHNTEDLLSVNGNTLMDNQSQAQAPDPQLRELGDNPGGDALSTLYLLAQQLAGVPGHKSLVWVASDNVLADWTHASLNVEKGTRNIEPAALRAQEAMNEAHVSVYPLDASQLEAGGLDASIADTNVQLNPTASSNQIGGCAAGAGGSRQSGTTGPEMTAGGDINTCSRDLRPGRLTAQMQADLHSIQGVYREIADATGGRPFRRASDIVAELNAVAADGRATYLLSFAPPQAADDKYHLITVKLPGHKGVNLRYRSGYFYRQEPTTVRDRFREAVLQPEEMTEIGLKADFVPDAKEKTVKLEIAAADLELAQADSFWTDKLDVFLVERALSGTKANVSGQSMTLHLMPGSYQKYLQEGVPFNQVLEVTPGVRSVRLIVYDENSGRMGSVTIPVGAAAKASS
jgi:VWFA-related protein